MFDGLQILSTMTKQDQTAPNKVAKLNGKMFGHQTMFDGVWSPNITRLDRP